MGQTHLPPPRGGCRRSRLGEYRVPTRRRIKKKTTIATQGQPTCWTCSPTGSHGRVRLCFQSCLLTLVVYVVFNFTIGPGLRFCATAAGKMPASPGGAASGRASGSRVSAFGFHGGIRRVAALETGLANADTRSDIQLPNSESRQAHKGAGMPERGRSVRLALHWAPCA